MQKSKEQHELSKVGDMFRFFFAEKGRTATTNKYLRELRLSLLELKSVLKDFSLFDVKYFRLFVRFPIRQRNKAVDENKKDKGRP